MQHGSHPIWPWNAVRTQERVQELYNASRVQWEITLITPVRSNTGKGCFVLRGALESSGKNSFVTWSTPSGLCSPSELPSRG